MWAAVGALLGIIGLFVAHYFRRKSKMEQIVEEKEEARKEVEKALTAVANKDYETLDQMLDRYHERIDGLQRMRKKPPTS